MRLKFPILILTDLLFTALGTGNVYFEENFDDDTWSTRWKISQHKKVGYPFGKFELTSGKLVGDAGNNGIRTSENGHLYAFSTLFPEFTNKNSSLVIQYSVKYEQIISYSSCAGGFIELFDCSFNPNDLKPETPYLIKFGPGLCDFANKVQVTFQRKGKDYPINKYILWTKDAYTHIYTFVLEVDGTYQVLLDGDSVRKGNVEKDFRFSARHTKFPRICGIGFNFWQSHSGTVFDNIILTDDAKVAEQRRKTIFLEWKITNELFKAIQYNNQSEMRRLSKTLQTVEEAKKVAEKSKAEEDRKAEEIRKVEAESKAEQERKAEEEKKAEAERKTQLEKESEEEKRRMEEKKTEEEKREAEANHKQNELNEKLRITIYAATTLVVLAVLIGMGCTYSLFRYRTKYLLSREEVNIFFQGSKATKRNVNESNRLLGGSGKAATQPYDRSKFELAPSLFKIDHTRILGSGEFGIVCRGFIKRGNAQMNVAVKMMHQYSSSAKSQYTHALKGLISEIKILSYLGEHDNIIKMEGAYTAKLRTGKLFVFLELCELGSLEKYLRSYNFLQKRQSTNDSCLIDDEIEKGDIAIKKRNTILTNEMTNDLHKWSVEIASAMEFLASKQIVHADLATRNVLLNAKKCTKIADFGLSRRLYNTQYTKSQVEPLPWRWMAPESLKKLIFNEKTDVWAFGVTLWEMYTLGDQPYPGLSWDVDFCRKLEGGLCLPEPKFNQENIFEVMKQCWEISPDDRPTFSELKSILNS